MDTPDKMLRVAGRKEDGTAGPVKLNGNGGVETNITGVDIALPVDLQYHALENDNPIPVKNVGQATSVINIANEVEVREGDIFTYTFEAFKYQGINAIWLNNSHDKDINVRIYAGLSDYFHSDLRFQINKDEGEFKIIPAESVVRVDFIDLPRLKNKFNYIHINIHPSPENIPVEGSITIDIEVANR